MVLHISIDGENNHQIALRLQQFLENKKYTTKLLTTQAYLNYYEKEYKLQNDEKIIINAFDRLTTYHNTDFNDIDIVIWENSIIQDLIRYANTQKLTRFLKQVNRNFIEMDLHILISNQQIQYKNLEIIKPTPNKDELLENIVKTIFDRLPTCNWCPRLFKPTKELKKYCSEKCREASLEEQYRINNRRYYHKYKDTMTERQKGGLGSKGANLHGTADPNPLKELEKVRNAKKALGLKPIR